MSDIKQRTSAWMEQRRGRFTASEIHRALGPIGHKRTQEALDLYSLEKAIEEIYGLPEEQGYISDDMKRGIALEPLAFGLFEDRKAKDFITVEQVGFLNYGDHAGVSSDGFCSNNYNLEIKCPRRTKYHKIVAVNDLSIIEPKHLYQMNMQMMAHGADNSYYVNYFQENGEEFLHEILVPRDKEICKLIDERIIILAERKQKHIINIKNNRQL